MFPREMAILMDIARDKDAGKWLINRPMDVISKYIGYLCDSLVRRGYITGNKTKGYQLTSMGRGTLTKFARKSQATDRDTIRRLGQLNIEYGQKLNKL